MQLVPPLLFDGPEGLHVSLDGDFVLFRTAAPARLTPERALELALELVELTAPDVMREVERALRSGRLRVVSGEGGDAA